MKKAAFLFFSSFMISTLLAQLPGRLGQNKISHAKFGDCEIFFYMDQEKSTLANNLIENVNEEMMITLGTAALPCPTKEILVQAIKYPDRDPQGTKILAEYAKNVHSIAEHRLGIQMTGLTWYMNLNLNWEALKIHHDRFSQQYHFMEENGLPPENYTLVQDLTLIDWQMSEGTVAGTMIQDGKFGDRYILCLFPNEVVGTFYTEPAYQLTLKTPDRYPGHISMPPHSTIAPMDMCSNDSCGSSKGKRMSTAVRGVVPTEQINDLKNQSESIPVNRRHPKLFQYGAGAEYANGIVIQPLSDKFLTVNTLDARMLGEKDNITYSQLSLASNAFIIEHLGSVFDIPIQKANIQALRLTKKDNGFSDLRIKKTQKNSKMRVILINSSKVPHGYRFFNLAENSTKKGFPWIQLYELNPGYAMEIPYKELKNISLAPCEELLYRNERYDALNDTKSELLPKIATHMDVFVFEVPDGI